MVMDTLLPSVPEPTNLYFSILNNHQSLSTGDGTKYLKSDTETRIKGRKRRVWVVGSIRTLFLYKILEIKMFNLTHI